MKPTAIFISTCPKECKNSKLERLFYSPEILYRLKLISDDEISYALIGAMSDNNYINTMEYSAGGQFLHSNSRQKFEGFPEWSNPELISFE